jgi:hypothetical protein
MPDRIAKLEKQHEELQTKVSRQDAAIDYDLQAKCSKDARAFFNTTFRSDRGTMLLDYWSHYNKRLNKCFIQSEHHYEFGKPSWINSVMLYDVYENSSYGAAGVFHHIDPKTFSDSASTSNCELLGKSCASLEEFVSLTRTYMYD